MDQSHRIDIRISRKRVRQCFWDWTSEYGKNLNTADEIIPGLERFYQWVDGESKPFNPLTLQIVRADIENYARGSPKRDVVHHNIIFQELNMVNFRLPIDVREGESSKHRSALTLIRRGGRDYASHNLPKFTLVALKAIYGFDIVAETNL